MACCHSHPIDHHQLDDVNPQMDFGWRSIRSPWWLFPSTPFSCCTDFDLFADFSFTTVSLLYIDHRSRGNGTLVILAMMNVLCNLLPKFMFLDSHESPEHLQLYKKYTPELPS